MKAWPPSTTKGQEVQPESGQKEAPLNYVANSINDYHRAFYTVTRNLSNLFSLHSSSLAPAILRPY